MASSGVQVLHPRARRGTVLADVDSAGDVFLVGAWLRPSRAGSWASSQLVGFYDALRNAGPVLVRTVLGLGLTLVTISHLVPIAMREANSCRTYLGRRRG